MGVKTVSEHDDLIVLVDEDGSELEFEVIDVIEVDGIEYAIYRKWDKRMMKQWCSELR